MIERVEVVMDPSVRNLCQKPYLGHRRGCPNYGKRDTCPPKTPLLNQVVDLGREVWAVWVEFDLEAHRNRMWLKHPKWSKRQAECCLYWQNRVRRVLLTELFKQKFAMEEKGLLEIEIPEAMGVNVTETMRAIGVELEWPPEKIVRKVGLIGFASLTWKKENPSKPVSTEMAFGDPDAVKKANAEVAKLPWCPDQRVSCPWRGEDGCVLKIACPLGPGGESCLG